MDVLVGFVVGQVNGLLPAALAQDRSSPRRRRPTAPRAAADPDAPGVRQRHPPRRVAVHPATTGPRPDHSLRRSRAGWVNCGRAFHDHQDWWGRGGSAHRPASTSCSGRHTYASSSATACEDSGDSDDNRSRWMKSGGLLVRSATGNLSRGNTTTGGGSNTTSDLGRWVDGRDHACVGHGDHPCVDKSWLSPRPSVLIVLKTTPDLGKCCRRATAYARISAVSVRATAYALIRCGCE